MFWFYLIGMICILAYAVLGLYGKKEEEEEKRREWHKQSIRRNYHNAYLEYWGKPELASSVFKKYSKTILSDNCEEWTDYEWEILEKELVNREKEEKRRKVRNEIDTKISLLVEYDYIRHNCPHGYSEYMKRYPDSTVEDVARNGCQIRNLEKNYLEAINKQGSSRCETFDKE